MMTRREAIQQLTAAVMAGNVTMEEDALRELHAAANLPPDPDEVLMERLLITAYDFRELLEQFAHLHAMSEPNGRCGCLDCHHVYGIHYALDNVGFLESEFHHTDRLFDRIKRHRKAEEARRVALKNHRAASA